LKDFLNENGVKKFWEMVCFIFGRIGFEIGKIFRIFIENEISWGYYSDHDPNSFHQNAHPNNLVVLPENMN
jgi:hypothetical protein